MLLWVWLSVSSNGHMQEFLKSMFLSTELLSYSVWRVSILKHKATLCFEVAHLLQPCVCGSASLPTLCISRHFNVYRSLKGKWYIITIFKVYLLDYEWDWMSSYMFICHLWFPFCEMPFCVFCLFSSWVQGVFKNISWVLCLW